MKLAASAETFAKALPGDMRQGAASGRTVPIDRQVWLMEEPFGALDALTRQVMQELLTDLWQRYRKTVLFVTHDIDEAVFLADVIYVMTTRPGHIRNTVPVDIPPPRTFETLGTEAFARFRRQG